MKYEKEKALCFVSIAVLAFFLVAIYPAGLCWAAEKTKLRFATNRTSKPIMAAYEKIIKAFEAKNPDYAVAYYNRSCYKCLAHAQISEILEDLKKAIQLDNAYREMAPLDEDFRSIREEPEFRQLIEAE